MTVCSTCGMEMKQGAKFCKSCGSSQQDSAQHKDKKSRVLAAEKRGGKKTALVLGIVAVAVVAGILFAVTTGRRGPAGISGPGASNIAFTKVSAEGGIVKLPIDEITDNAARYFVLAAGGKEVKFFALRAPDGTIRVALDACQSCYRAKLGYHQQGDAMICNNCGLSFRSQDIGVIRGGCNPIPVNNTTDGKLIMVNAKDLESGAQYF